MAAQYFIIVIIIIIAVWLSNIMAGIRMLDACVYTVYVPIHKDALCSHNSNENLGQAFLKVFSGMDFFRTIA